MTEPMTGAREMPRDRKPGWLEEQNRIDAAAANRIPGHLRVFKDKSERMNEEVSSTDYADYVRPV